MSAPFPPPLREAARLAALYRYEILDSPPEKELDDLVHLASYICNTPISLISLVDSDRQWFKSKVGLTATQTSRIIAFCAHAILDDNLLIVPDTLADERFKNNPLVTGDPHIRFYCGAPLITPEGFRIGTLNVIDHIPRELSAEQLEAIRVLSRQAMNHMTLDREHRELVQAVKEQKRAEEDLRASEAKFRILIESSPSAIFIYRGDRILYVNQAAALISGYPVEELLTMDMWTMGHPEFLPLLKAHTMAAQGDAKPPVRFEFKIIRNDGRERWLDFTEATIDYGGQPARLATGYDITKRKQGEMSLKIQSRGLELIALGAPLREILDTLVRSIESQSDGMLASILLLDADGVHVRCGAAPSLPESFIRAIDGQPIGPSAGSCGTAAFRREAVIVEDIATDPLWENYRAYALPHGLRACWSTPIIDTQKRVLGTFALYFRTPGRPTARQIRLVTMATHTAALAIDRELKDKALVEREALMHLFIEHSPASLAMFDCNMRYLAVSRRWLTDYKLGDGPLTGRSHYEVFPDVPQRWKEIHRRCLAGAEEECQEDIFVRDDGRTDWLRWKIIPWRTDGGDIGGIVILTEDITERKQAESVLRRNEERLQQALADAENRERTLRTVLDSEPECVKMLDAQGAVLTMNRAGLAMVEADDLVQVEHQCLYPLIEEEDREPFRRLTEAVFHGESGILEFKMVGLKGTRRWLETHASPLRDQAGAVTALLGITRDITEKKRADEALLASETRLQAILDYSPVIVFLKDRDGRYLFINRMFEQRFGLLHDQIIGKTDHDLFSPEQAATFRRNDRDVLQTGAAIEFEEMAQYGDGEHAGIVVKFPIRDAKEEIYAIGGFVTDITDRKNAEEALRKSEERFRLVALATNDVLWDWDLMTNDHWWSPNAREKFGYDSDVEPSIQARTSRLHPDDQKEVLKTIDESLTGPIQFWSGEYRFRLGDGAYGYFLDRGHIVRDTTGKPVRMIGAMIDVTEAKQAFASLKDAYTRLQAMTREVRVAEEKERRRLSRELHDEFGQLLSAVKFDLNDIREGLLKVRSLNVTALRRKIKSAMGTVDRLFVSFREVLAALRPATLEVLGLIPSIQAVADELQGRTGIRCRVVTKRDDIRALCGTDVEGTLYRIAQELLLNIERHAEATAATVSLECADGWVKMTVQDDGVGFTAQQHPPEDRFGLPGIQERAEILGGSVSIRSEPGTGTDVTVRLPYESPAASRGTVSATRKAKPPTNRKRRKHG